MKILIGVILFTIGNILAWFQFNSQFVWDWWKDKPFVTVLIYAIPMSLCFWCGTKIIVEETDALWTSRLIAFSASYLIFPALTWCMAGESPLTAKTIICTLLAIGIICTQLFWK